MGHSLLAGKNFSGAFSRMIFIILATKALKDWKVVWLTTFLSKTLIVHQGVILEDAQDLEAKGA